MPDRPEGLYRVQLANLQKLCEEATNLSIDELAGNARRHANLASRINKENKFVNDKLADAIASSIEQVAQGWNQMDDSAKFWLVGAIKYFVDSDDDAADFKSPIGFEDDVEILNACLIFARLDHLCINVEDY